MNSILQVKDLSKSFRSHWTFKKKAGIEGISFSVAEGESFALLGANGAGKTTTIKNILGFLIPDAGEIHFKGSPLFSPAQRTEIGFLPEQPYFYQYLTVEETLNFYAALFSIRPSERTERVKYVLDRLALLHKAKDKVKSLSKGQQQRVGLAQVLLNNPSLLILDEPFSGLDPLARVEIRNLLLDLKKQGTSMIISSHILSDIEMLCDRAVILNKGRIGEEINIGQLLDSGEAVYKVSVRGDLGSVSSGESSDMLKEILSHVTSGKIVSGVSIYEFSGYEEARRLMKFCFDYEFTVLEFSRAHRTLEDIFISATSAKK